jgi:hypothetical protein
MLYRRSPICFAEWRVREVGADYHVELDDHSYGVPAVNCPDRMKRSPGPRRGVTNRSRCVLVAQRCVLVLSLVGGIDGQRRQE